MVFRRSYTGFVSIGIHAPMWLIMVFVYNDSNSMSSELELKDDVTIGVMIM